MAVLSTHYSSVIEMNWEHHTVQMAAMHWNFQGGTLTGFPLVGIEW